MTYPRPILFATFLLLSATPAWACGVGGGGELVLFLLGFFAMEAFVSSLIAGFLAQRLIKRKRAFPKLTMLGSVIMGTGFGSIGALVGSAAGPVGMLASTAAAAGFASALVAFLSPALKGSASAMVEPKGLPQADPDLLPYDTAEEWKPL